MRLLLDESLPRSLARRIEGYPVETVFDRGWSGLKNGELLTKASEHFDVFVTADQNLQYQQNLEGYDIAVLVLAALTNRVDDLAPLLSQMQTALGGIEPGEVRVVRRTT